MEGFELEGPNPSKPGGQGDVAQSIIDLLSLLFN